VATGRANAGGGRNADALWALESQHTGVLSGHIRRRPERAHRAMPKPGAAAEGDVPSCARRGLYARDASQCIAAQPSSRMGQRSIIACEPAAAVSHTVPVSLRRPTATALLSPRDLSAASPRPLRCLPATAASPLVCRCWNWRRQGCRARTPCSSSDLPRAARTAAAVRAAGRRSTRRSCGIRPH